MECVKQAAAAVDGGRLNNFEISATFIGPFLGRLRLLPRFRLTLRLDLRLSLRLSLRVRFFTRP